jgi:N-dimethylarginine dimethylaminohydrolase
MTPRFLLCAPDHYDTHFLFNPFMGYRERVEPRRAAAQWRRLVGVLEQAGAEVEPARPAPVTGALPFTADGALVYAPGRAVVLRNDGLRGDLEPPVFTGWLRGLGYATESLPPRYRIDGGNLLRLTSGDFLAGLKPGATGLAERYLDRLLRRITGARVLTVELAGPPWLHLDTVVGVLGPQTYLVHPGGLAGGTLPRTGPFANADVIEVDADDARRFACNVVVVGDVVVTGPISTGLERRIARRGFQVERVDLSEFYKAGGGAKCLTLPLWSQSTTGGAVP